MPELPDREQLNEDLAAALLLLWAEDAARLSQLLGDPPDVRNVPPAYWAEVNERTAASLQTNLAGVFVLAAAQQAEQFALEVEAEAIELQAQTWAAERAAVLVDDLTTRTQDVIRDSVRTYYEEGEDEAAIEAGLRVAFGDSRAAGVATTTITEAGVRGEDLVVVMFTLETGYDVEEFWRCEAGACEYCLSVEDTTREVWGQVYPEGPGSPHPHCQCWLDRVPIDTGELAEV